MLILLNIKHKEITPTLVYVIKLSGSSGLFIYLLAVNKVKMDLRQTNSGFIIHSLKKQAQIILTFFFFILQTLQRKISISGNIFYFAFLKIPFNQPQQAIWQY